MCKISRVWVIIKSHFVRYTTWLQEKDSSFLLTHLSCATVITSYNSVPWNTSLHISIFTGFLCAVKMSRFKKRMKQSSL